MSSPAAALNKIQLSLHTPLRGNIHTPMIVVALNRDQNTIKMRLLLMLIVKALGIPQSGTHSQSQPRSINKQI